MLALSRLSDTAVAPCEPWRFTPHPPIDDRIRKDKSLRDKWANDPATVHNFYNAWEGLNGNLRLSRAKGPDKEENPPHKLHGLVVDFDTKLTQDEVAAGLDRLSPLVPNYYEVSLSGKCHLVWRFAKPLVISGFPLAEAFLKLAADKLRLHFALPGFDKAFFNPVIHYTNSGEWFEINPEPLSAALTMGWLVDAASKVDWAEQGYSVPLTVVREQLLKDPKFANSEWANMEFVLGAQGPTWWVEGSTSPKSAVVKESGMFTYSATATKNFYTWGDMLGYSFVDQFRSSQIGNAVEGIYFDGRGFWREITRGDWKLFSKDDILHYLRVSRNLSNRTAKGDDKSELDIAYQHIQDHGNVDGAAPFVFKQNGLISVHDKPFLNTHTATVLRPHDDLTPWGPTGGFPTISQFFGPPSIVDANPDTPRLLKGGPLPLDTFLSWLSLFYRSGHELSLQSGHNIFISGPVNIGKTFLNRAIIGALMSGYRVAEDYLMGEDHFGSELFSVAHWVVDDNAVSTSTMRHRKWSEMIKRMAANKTFRYHEKFRNAMQVTWQGRVVATLNSDEESARILPDLDRSLLDKIMLFRTVDAPTINFPPEAEMQEILARELPYFARYLLAWKTPDNCVLRRGDTPDAPIDYRFGGIKPYHDPALVQHANQGSRNAGFVEILADWMEEHFRIENENKTGGDRVTKWEGTAFQLRKAMCAANPATQDALRGESVSDIGRHLSQLKAKGYDILFSDAGDLRYWTLHEPNTSQT